MPRHALREALRRGDTVCMSRKPQNLPSFKYEDLKASSIQRNTPPTFQHQTPHPSPKDPGRGVPSGIFVTPLPPVFHFVKRIPTPPVLHKTGDYPPIVPVPKGVFHVERPASGGGAPTPPAQEKGGGVIA